MAILPGEGTQTPVTLPEPVAPADPFPSLDAILAAHKPAEAPVPAAVPAPVEAAPVAPPVPEAPKPDVEYLAKLEAVVAQERAIQERSQQLEAQSKAWEAERVKLEALKKYAEADELLQEKDVLAGLKKLGYTFDDLSKAALAGRGVRPYAPMERKIDQLSNDLQTRIQQLEGELASQRQERAVSEVKQQVAAANSPILAALGENATQAVMTKFQQHYSETGKVPTYAQVIKEVEADAVSFLDPFFRNEAVRQRFLGESRPSDPKAAPEAAKTVTLANAHSAQVSQRQPARSADFIEDQEAALKEILARHT